MSLKKQGLKSNLKSLSKENSILTCENKKLVDSIESMKIWKEYFWKRISNRKQALKDKILSLENTLADYENLKRKVDDFKCLCREVHKWKKQLWKTPWNTKKCF